MSTTTVLIKKLIVGAFIFGTFLSASHARDEFSDRFEFSGFGRIVGGYLDEDSASYFGYKNNLSLSQQSLLALQTDFTFNDKVSVSAQLLAHSSEDRDSGIEWLYVKYEPNKQWRFKAGKLRTPFFRYSDVNDVGFAYPWITTPQQVYSGFLFSNYEGVTGTYRFGLDSSNIEIEAYYGAFEDEFNRAGETVPIEVDEIKGLILSVYNGNLTMRASVTQSSDFFADVAEFTQFANALEFAGFLENADSLRFNGKLTGYQANINYDTLDYFVSAEWVKIESDLLVVPQVSAYYVSAGYNFSPFQLHLTYSSSDSANDAAENLIPVGISPQLDQLSFVYDQITGNLPVYSLDSLAVGVRWDLNHYMALKADITFLDGAAGELSLFGDITDPNFDREATLYQIALEWVF